MIEEFIKESPDQAKDGKSTFDETLNILIKEFGPIDKNVIKKQYKNEESYVNQFLKSVNSAPNDHQTCIAAYAILKLNHSPSQMWELLGGRGKSRVIAKIAYMLIELSLIHI